MEDRVGAICALANAMVKGKTLRELTELQIALQLISSVVNAEIALRRQDGANGAPRP